jgi:hypothetical protein
MSLEELRKDIQQMQFPTDQSGGEDDAVQGEEQEGEGEQGKGEGQVEDTKEPTAQVEEPEETPEQRYARLLEDLNSANAKILELEAGQGRTEPVQPTAQAPEPGAMPALPKNLERPTIQFDLDKLRNGLVEDDAETVVQVLQGIVDYIGKVADFTHERMLVGLPEVADRVAIQRVNLTLAVHDFYRENPDLQSHRGICGAITNEVVAENPNQTLQSVFTEVEKRARKKLGLKKTIQDAEHSDDRSSPAFAKKSGSRKPGAPQLTGIKGDIAAMQAAQRR